VKRYGLTLNLKPETLEVYKEHHRRVWPEVEAGLKRIGIREMTIFLTGRRLFMYAVTEEGFNWDTDFVSYLEDPVCAAWQKLMDGFQAPVPEAGPGEWWARMEEVYHLE